MKKKKSFTAPLWILGMLLLVAVFLLVAMIVAYLTMDRASDMSQYTSSIIRSVLVRYGLVILFLMLEFLLYYRFRKDIRRKGPAWGHLVFLMIALMVPFIFVFVGHSPQTGTAMEMLERQKILNILRGGLFWAFIVLAHALLIIVLRDAIAVRRNVLNEPPTDTGDILSEYSV